MRVLLKAEAETKSNSDMILVRIDRGQLCDVELYVTQDALIEIPPHGKLLETIDDVPTVIEVKE